MFWLFQRHQNVAFFALFALFFMQFSTAATHRWCYDSGLPSLLPLPGSTISRCSLRQHTEQMYSVLIERERTP